MFNKKGEMGIGTLIIFISLLLVAAIAAGVLIQTSGSLQEKALSTGDQAKGQIATNVRVVEVSATDGSDGTVRYFTQIIKLAPGSEAVKLSQVLFTLNTFDKTATLKYSGTGSTLSNEVGGYSTLTIENVTGGPAAWNSPKGDYDNDGTVDVVSGGASSPVWLNLSSGTDVLLGNCSAGTWTSLVTTNNYVASAIGYCDAGAPNNTSSVTLTPRTSGTGTFAVEYLQMGSNWVNGNLQRGDIIKLYYEAPKDIGEDEHVRLNFIPKIGTPTLTEFITPEVVSEERIYLYP